MSLWPYVFFFFLHVCTRGKRKIRIIDIHLIKHNPNRLSYFLWSIVTLCCSHVKHKQKHQIIKLMTDRQSLHWFTQSSWCVTFHGSIILCSFEPHKRTTTNQTCWSFEYWNDIPKGISLRLEFWNSKRAKVEELVMLWSKYQKVKELVWNHEKKQKHSPFISIDYCMCHKA
jgi:hypothetical protein